MEILLLILNKGFMFMFFMSFLNLIRHTYNLIQTYYIGSEDENVRYIVEPKDLLILAVSIAIVLTSMFTGIQLN